MYTEEDLDAAVQAGVIDAPAAERFRAFIAGQRSGALADEEHFRLVSSFNDIFVVIASALLLVSIGFLVTAMAVPATGALAVAAVAWALAESFTRRRRMALPSIVLFLAFVGGLFAGVHGLLPDGGEPFSYGPAGLLAGVAAWFHWRRFGVPITVAGGAGVMVVALLSFLIWIFPAWREGLSGPVFVAGLLVFMLALRWDASDLARRTRRSDVAFWLHLLAAPLLVHPAFSGLGGEPQYGLSNLLVVLILYGAIAVLSLALDRRALMVSALGYVLYSLASLLKPDGSDGASATGFTFAAALIGAALLLLSAYWHPARRHVLRYLPPGWLARVPPAVER